MPANPNALPQRVLRTIRIAAADHGVTSEMVLSGSRQKSISAARADAMRMLRGMGYSYPLVARFLGVHRASVIYRIKQGRLTKRQADQIISVPDLSGEWAI